MDRRRFGWLLVAVVLLAVLAVPALRNTSQTGLATAASVERVPVAGDCLLRRPSDVPHVDVRGTDGLAGPESGPCSRLHFGEMIAVVRDGSAFPRAVVDRLSAPDLGFCEHAAQTYLGLAERPSSGTPGQSDVGFGLWYPVERGWLRLTGPSPRQQQLGQQWVGCAMYSDDVAYLGSVRGSFVSGRMPNAFALCRNDNGEAASVDCAARHRVELFGTATLTGSQINQADLTSSCESMVRRVTRMPDPTGGGRLVIRATLFHTGSDGVRRQGLPTRSDVRASAGAVCSIAVTNAQSLRGTVFGLGSGPVPLS